VLRNSPYKASPGKIINKNDVFSLLKTNGWMKKKIIDMIKQLKEVSKRMRESKHRYQNLRNKLERQQPRRLYKAVKGDLVDELFADYINRLNCPVPIKRLGNNQYTFGTKKIYAKIINGKLVIRVGGGYMGIEEFMMYYGQQELQKIQKEELMKVHTDEGDDFLTIGGGLLDNDFLSEDEDGGFCRKSKGPADIDIDELKEKLKESSRKSRKLNKSFGSDHEEESKMPILFFLESDAAKHTVVGIGDVRKALKKNVFQIKTYEEGKGGQKAKQGKQVSAANSNQVERELRNIEKRVGKKLHQQETASGLAGRASPLREKQKSTENYASSQQKVTQEEEPQIQRHKFQSKIPSISKK